MATPTLAWLKAGASFTPSPVTATISPLACSASTMRSLCSGLTRANTSVSRTVSTSCSGDMASSWTPVTTDVGPHPELLTDRSGGARLVAGDHHDPDPRSSAFLHRDDRLGTGRVGQTHDAQQLDVGEGVSASMAVPPRLRAIASVRSALADISSTATRSESAPGVPS
jgi:hypothetical protein